MQVRIESLDYAHPRRGAHAVRDASLEIRSGEVLGLIGPNGAGKTTLLSCVLGFLPPRRGRVLVDGRACDDLEVRRRTGLLTEKPVFPAGYDARGVIGFHHALLQRPRESRRREADALLERVGLGHVAARRASTFSHGMRQRLGLACALLGDPGLLVLDEPTTGLDPAAVALTRDEIRRARDRGATVILSSHQLDEIERSCDRIVVMSQGRLEPPRLAHDARSESRTMRIVVGLPGGGLAPAQALREALASLPFVLDVDPGRARLAVGRDEDVRDAVAALLAAGLLVLEVRSETSRLEALLGGGGP